MEEKKLVPKLRFPGFTEPWEQRKFGELFILKSGVAFKLSEYTKTGIPIINGESIKAGKISLEKVNYLPNEYQYKYQECLLFPGDIVLGLNRPIIDGELKISRIPSDIKTCLLYQRAGKIIFKVNMEENFTYQLLSKEVLTFTRREAVGSDQPFITTTKLNKWNLYLPVKDEERRKIGNLLDNINNIITLHQRKLEHLKLKKKSLLQKLFPKEGEVYPELRFPGFTAPWEQRKLGEEAIEILAGGDIEKEKVVYDSGYPIYANALTNDGLVGYYTDYYRVEAPAVTVTGRGEVGHAQARSQNFTPIVRLLAIRSKHDCYFLENAINNYKTIVESTGVPQLTVPQLSAYKLCFPLNIEEEKRISICFQNLDTLITLHQRKLEHLQLLKKALLQQLFV